MKHEFPEEVVTIAKRLKVTDAELDSIYTWLKHFDRDVYKPVQALEAGPALKNVLKVLSMDDVDNTEFTEDQNQFLNSLLQLNLGKDLTGAIQWCINQCMTIQPVNVAEEWFPADLPPKNDSMVLGEDNEGASYIVKYVDGGPRECHNILECEHPDHNEVTDGKCREMKEGFYEVVQDFIAEGGFNEVLRHIIKWRSIPKSN